MRTKGDWRLKYDLAALPADDGYFQDVAERHAPGTGMDIITAEREACVSKTERLREARLSAASRSRS